MQSEHKAVRKTVMNLVVAWKNHDFQPQLNLVCFPEIFVPKVIILILIIRENSSYKMKTPSTFCPLTSKFTYSECNLLIPTSPSGLILNIPS